MRRVVHHALFLCLLAAPILLSASDTPKGDPPPENKEKGLDSRTILREGLNAFYNSRYDEAEAKFREYIALAPDDDVGDWRLASTLYFRWRFIYKANFPKLSNPGEYQAFVKLLYGGIEKSKRKIEVRDNVDFHLFVEASFYSLLATMQVNNETHSAAGSTVHDKVLPLAKQSGYQDAKYLIGLANYGLSLLPWYKQVGVVLRGLPHDRQTGLRLIFEAAANNKNPFADDVWFVIFGIETDQRNVGQYSREEIDQLFNYLRKYPENEAVQGYAKR